MRGSKPLSKPLLLYHRGARFAIAVYFVELNVSKGVAQLNIFIHFYRVRSGDGDEKAFN
jgi:hypothetical protein